MVSYFGWVVLVLVCAVALTALIAGMAKIAGLTSTEVEEPSRCYPSDQQRPYMKNVQRINLEIIIHQL